MITEQIILPWPLKELNPNARGHWASKRKAVKMYRTACCVLTIASNVKITWDGDVIAFIDFYPPDKRMRDDDNVFASFKSGRDGVCDALKINDSRIIMRPFLYKNKIGGMVKISFSEALKNE